MDSADVKTRNGLAITHDSDTEEDPNDMDFNPVHNTNGIGVLKQAHVKSSVNNLEEKDDIRVFACDIRTSEVKEEEDITLPQGLEQEDDPNDMIFYPVHNTNDIGILKQADGNSCINNLEKKDDISTYDIRPSEIVTVEEEAQNIITFPEAHGKSSTNLEKKDDISKCDIQTSEGVVIVKEEAREVTLIESPPRKRMRFAFDGVVVPTLKLLNHRRKEEAKEDYAKLKMMKNPKAAKKLEAIAFAIKTLRNRLNEVGLEVETRYITLDKVTQEAMVTRRFISSVYGGNMQMTFPQISEAKLATHNYGNRFMFLNTDYQPMAPQIPAAPGLFIDCEAEPTDWGESGEWRVFSKVGKAWLFVGFYRLAASKRPSMSQEEWEEQSEKFRNKWALKITQKGWGVRVCARTLARKELNREPTRKEVLDIIESGRYKATTPDEVKAAYDAGKEKMGIWTLKCIG